MADWTYKLTLDPTGQIVTGGWDDPRPFEGDASVGDNVHFRGVGGEIVIRFKDESPFDSTAQPGKTIEHKSANGVLELEAKSVKPIRHFDCAIEKDGKRVFKEQKKGDDFPVDKTGGH